MTPCKRFKKLVRTVIMTLLNTIVNLVAFSQMSQTNINYFIVKNVKDVLLEVDKTTSTVMVAKYAYLKK